MTPHRAGLSAPQHQLRPGPHQRIQPIRRRHPRLPLAQLILQHRKHPHMMRTALLIHRRHRLGPDHLPPARMHRLVRHPVAGPLRILHRPDRRLHHLAAVVHLGHHAIRLVPVIRRDRCLRPRQRRPLHRQIIQHVQVQLVRRRISRHPGHHDPGLIPGGCGAGVHPHHHPLQVRRPQHPVLLDDPPAPQRRRVIVQDLPVDLLPAQARPLVRLDHLAEVRRRQVIDVIPGRPLHIHRIPICPQRLDQRDRPGRRRHTHLGPLPDPQPK